MFENLSSYLNSVQRAWSAQDGRVVASLISLKDRHVVSRSLQLEMPENMVERILDSPIDDIVSSHLKVLYYLTCERKKTTYFLEVILNLLWILARNYSSAYKCQAACAKAVVDLLKFLKEENWCLPIMYVVCLDLRILAQKCEEVGNSSKPGEILESAAECLMACFRVCAVDNRWVIHTQQPK